MDTQQFVSNECDTKQFVSNECDTKQFVSNECDTKQFVSNECDQVRLSSRIFRRLGIFHEGIFIFLAAKKKQN